MALLGVFHAKMNVITYLYPIGIHYKAYYSPKESKIKKVYFFQLVILDSVKRIEHFNPCIF